MCELVTLFHGLLYAPNLIFGREKYWCSEVRISWRWFKNKCYSIATNWSVFPIVGWNLVYSEASEAPRAVDDSISRMKNLVLSQNDHHRSEFHGFVSLGLCDYQLPSTGFPVAFGAFSAL